MGKTNLGRVTFVPRGTYSNETAYKRLDVVEHEGNSFLFLKDSTGVVPIGDNVVTMFLAKKGKDFAYEDFTPEQLAALKGADGKDGTKGDKGDPGKGLTILGYYGTLDLLKAAITTPTPGDAYGIGEVAPYDIYVYDGVTNDWVNNGKLSGGGEGGENVVLIPAAVLSLTNASTSEEILNVFGGKEAFIDVVTKVKEGIPAVCHIKEDGIDGYESLKTTVAMVDNDSYALNFVGIGDSSFSITISLTGDIATLENVDYPLILANKTSMLTKGMLVSDPSVGGIDRPASAEAVKKVNDKIKYGTVQVPICTPEPDYDSVILLWKLPTNIAEEVTYKRTIIGDLFGTDPDSSGIFLDVKFSITILSGILAFGRGYSSSPNLAKLCECRYNNERYIAIQYTSDGHFPINEFIGHVSYPALFSVIRYFYRANSIIINQEIKDSILPVTQYFKAFP